MKHLCFGTLLLLGLGTTAQTHHLGFNFGINQILSPDEDPPFGRGSPWEYTLGFGYEVSYNYTFKNNLTLGLNVGYLNPKFIAYNESTFIEELNERVEADKVLTHYYYSTYFKVGYAWPLGKRYSIQVNTGPLIFYNGKEKSYYKGYAQTLYISELIFSKDYINYGVNLNIDQSYNLIQDWNYRLNLIASLGCTYIIDYLHYPNSINRLLPQAYLGLELELGRRKR